MDDHAQYSWWAARCALGPVGACTDATHVQACWWATVYPKQSKHRMVSVCPLEHEWVLCQLGSMASCEYHHHNGLPGGLRWCPSFPRPMGPDTESTGPDQSTVEGEGSEAGKWTPASMHAAVYNIVYMPCASLGAIPSPCTLTPSLAMLQCRGLPPHHSTLARNIDQAIGARQ